MNNKKYIIELVNKINEIVIRLNFKTCQKLKHSTSVTFSNCFAVMIVKTNFTYCFSGMKT